MIDLLEFFEEFVDVIGWQVENSACLVASAGELGYVWVVAEIADVQVGEGADVAGKAGGEPAGGLLWMVVSQQCFADDVEHVRVVGVEPARLADHFEGFGVASLVEQE